MSDKRLYTQSMFMDSGAFSLFNKHVRDTVRGPWEKAPGYKHYSLEKGSEFRAYCDRYAVWIKEMEAQGLHAPDLLFTNVDAIRNGEITWQIQQYFEQEHGVQPVPVVHGKTDLKYVERYLSAGRYKLLGMGGLGHSISHAQYTAWADNVYRLICPASNRYMPTIRTHGFAMTSWKLICRYPWWSVDSATWVKLAAYGWLYVPRWWEERWRFDEPPVQVNASWRSPQKQREKHVLTMGKEVLDIVERWLARWGLDLGSVEVTAAEEKLMMRKGGRMAPLDEGFGDRNDADTNEQNYGRTQRSIDVVEEEDLDEFTMSGHFTARSTSNLHYLKDLEESRPPWPYPLDPVVTHDIRRRYKGFGL